MKLSRKTFIYSTIISIIIVSLIIGYFILMLPSLYVDYMEDRNLNSVTGLQKGVMKYGSYDKLEVNNPTSTITLKIPDSGNTFYILNKFFQTSVEIRDKDFEDILDKVRYYSNHRDEMKNFHMKDIDLKKLKKKLTSDQTLKDNFPLKFTFRKMEYKNTYQQVSSRMHLMNSNLAVYEANVTDGQNYYTSYAALGIMDHTIYITFVPTMTPRIEEIKPVILQSMPMILAVALLLILISSQVFSRFIVNPIIRLAQHAQYMRDCESLKLEPLKLSGHDEISVLADSLNKLYGRIQENYRELEIKNQYLAEENLRQEVFLRASSHQLKTPVTAALLLVDGMMNEIGKYKDTKVYLPQVKKQLQSMQKIVEDILYLNHCSEHLQLDHHLLSQIMEDCLASYHVQIEKKALQIITKGYIPEIITDRELMGKILDNLLSNAVNYSPEHGKIEIIYEENKLYIQNYGVTIEEELLPHVFEAFVTSNNSTKGHGLGLYIVSYYAKLLGCQVKLINIDNGVSAQLIIR